MDTVTIVVLTVVIAALAGALAWYGPRRRHWQTHSRGTEDTHDRHRPGSGEGESRDDGTGVDGQIEEGWEGHSMPNAIGHHRWAVAEGYIPDSSTGPEPAMLSHETMCILNAGTSPANVEVTLYFADRDPAGPYRVRVPSQRTAHVRFNDLDDPEPVPRATDYAFVVEADEPIVVQHTRLDSRQAENALLSTMAFPVAD